MGFKKRDGWDSTTEWITGGGSGGVLTSGNTHTVLSKTITVLTSGYREIIWSGFFFRAGGAGLSDVLVGFYLDDVVKDSEDESQNPGSNTTYWHRGDILVYLEKGSHTLKVKIVNSGPTDITTYTTIDLHEKAVTSAGDLGTTLDGVFIIMPIKTGETVT